MASFIAKKVGRNMFASQAASMEPADPHYETYEDHRGRVKSRKRKMPSGLTKRDERILRSVRRRAHYLDKGFTCCGFRFGWTAILGLIPFAGDITSFLLSYFLVLRKCRQADLPFALSQRMAFNTAVSLGVGLVPLVGDLIMAVWKGNSRNAALLEAFLIQRAAEQNPGTAADEEAAARQALRSSTINPLSGERIGGPPPYRLSEEVENEDSKAVKKQKQGAKGKSWYGWGKKSTEEEDDQRPLNGSSTAPVVVAGSSSQAQQTVPTAATPVTGNKLRKGPPGGVAGGR